MFVLLVFISSLLSCQAASKSYDGSSKLLNCSYSYQLEKSMAKRDRAWIVSNNLETGQDIICSHMITSDGLRMCACACQTNMNGISNGNDIKWTVPKYKKCSHPEDEKDDRLYCYDLATTDQNRKCSCTCSTVKDEASPLNSENDASSLELKEKKTGGKSEYRVSLAESKSLAGQTVQISAMKGDLLPSIIDEPTGPKIINPKRIGNEKTQSSDPMDIYMYITHSPGSLNESIQKKAVGNPGALGKEDSVPSKLASAFNSEAFATILDDRADITSKPDLRITLEEAVRPQTDSSRINTTSLSSVDLLPNIDDDGPYVVYVTTDKKYTENDIFKSDKLQSPKDSIVEIEMLYPEGKFKNLGESLFPKEEEDMVISIVEPSEEVVKQSAQNTQSITDNLNNNSVNRSMAVKDSNAEVDALLGPIMPNMVIEKNVVRENSPQIKQPRLIFYTDAIKSPQDVLSLDVDSPDALPQHPSESNKPEDNIVVVYPKTSFVNSKSHREATKQMHQNAHVASRATKTDEKVVYVYSQSVTPSPESLEAAYITPENMKVWNMSRQDTWHTVSKQSSVSSSAGMRPNSVVPTHDTLLSVEKTKGSPIVISVYPVAKNESEQMMKYEEKSVGPIEANEPTNEVLSSDDSASEKLKEIDDAEDYLEDESVTIAYSAKVFQSVPSDTPAETPLGMEQGTHIKMDPVDTPSTEKLDSFLSDQKKPLAQEIGALPATSSTQSSVLSTSSTTFEIAPPSSTSPKPLSVSPPLTTSKAPSTPKSIISPTHSSQDDMVETMKLSPQDELKLKRQNQFMEFLKRKSHESSRHRLTATSLKRPSTTHVPLTEIRKMLLDAAQRRNALLKGRDHGKMPTNESESGMDRKEKVEEAPQTDSSISSTTAEPKTTPHAKRGAILHRRPLHVRTTRTPADLTGQ